MSTPEDNEENLLNIMNDICIQLNIDENATKRAKDSFLEINRNYTLDGDPLHWMACAMYVACRSSLTPTVQTGKAVQGNCVSSTQLLRICNISLIQFFTKIKNWMEMAALSSEFKDRMARLERKFAVSTVVFRKFQPIFKDIFSGLSDTIKSPPVHKSKKPKLQPCTTNALFEFTWCLYVCVKGEFHSSSDDLVDMYHILLACLDYVFANAFMAERTDLINPSFKGLPSDWMRDTFKVPSKPPCVMATLCDIVEGLAVEAATMKEYSFKPTIQSFFEKGILHGDKETHMGLLDVGKFEANLKSLNNTYETYVLSVGDFDERIFLGDHGVEQVGTNRPKATGEEISQALAISAKTSPETPLTGRRYLASREALTPVSEATNSLAHLAAFLRPFHPQQLNKLAKEWGIDQETIQTHLVEPQQRWCSLLGARLRDSLSAESARYRCDMTTALYYKLLAHIVREEHRKKPQASLQMLLTQQSYQLALWACCCEVIVQAYGINSLRFPCVLQLYQLPAFHFYKIIELCVQAVVDKLSRDVIKHLNAVEEEVLESMVWTSDSPLWELLKTTPVPPSIDVYIHESPQVKRNNGGIQSSLADQAKKQLFRDTVKPGQSLLVSPPSTKDGASPALVSADNTPDSTPKKANNSLKLFFRKFYNLAVVRMNNLCEQLQLTDEVLKCKIWTCLEHALMHQTELMRDRHLDQILMCTVYVICKVSHNESNPVERTFADIMRCYRQRPLAHSHVYRSVLLGEPGARGDLINFYNRVYVRAMQDVALNFTGRHKDECSLSPLPAGRVAARSPGGQRVSERHMLYVKPLTEAPPPHHLMYRFSRSPAKDLHAINTMVSSEVCGVKRGGGVSCELMKRPRAAPSVARKLHAVMSDRHQL